MYRTLLLFLLCLIGMSVADEATSKKPITEGEAREFCKEFAAKFQSGDARWLSDHMDFSEMAWKATDHSKADFATGFRQSWIEKKGGLLPVASKFAAMATECADYRFRKLEKEGDTWKGTFRFLGKDGATNFHEWDIVRSANGTIVVSELYNYLTGENLLDGNQKAFRDASKRFAQSPAEQLRVKADFEKLGRMSADRQKGAFQSILDTYDQLPDHLKKMKMVAMMRLQAASNINEKTYRVVLSEYEKEFPDDPAKEFVSIDAFILAKNYTQACAAIDRLNKLVGGDGHLAYMKASVQLLNEAPQDAIKIAQEGLVVENDYQNLYDLILSTSLKTKDHKLTKEMLDALETKFALEITTDIATSPDFKDFVKSPEYAEWNKGREKRSDKSKTGANP